MTRARVAEAVLDATRANSDRILRLSLVAALAAAALAIQQAQAATASVTCDRWASTAGVDTNPGTEAQPVRSIAKLIQLLSAPIQAGARHGCLVAGQTFVEPIGDFLIGALGGTTNDPVVIQSSGAPRASVRAQVGLQEASHDITFTDLNFLGTPNNAGASMLLIDGDRIVFRNNDISYVNGICVDVGFIDGQTGAVGDPADDFVLDRNRIHNCGTSRPMNDLGTSGLHGVYIENTNDAVVTNNYIFDNMNRGLQLFPLAQNTLVEFNVLDGNSSNLNIGGYEPLNRFSDNNIARNNIITNALLKTYFVPGWPVTGDISSVVGNFPQNHRVTNTVTGNCLWYDDPNLRQATYYFEGFGIDFSGNTFADPLYVNRAGKDFALQAGSPCAGKGPQPEVTTTCNGSPATITGTAGNDVLTGTAGADVILGLGGNDTISGLAGNDKICAGDGDDLVLPGLGSETNVEGGAGTDTISYADATSVATINLGQGEMFHPPGDPEYDTFSLFENAIGSSSVGNTLVGTLLANRLEGGAGADALHGAAGNDVLIGGAGLDEFHGAEGDDRILARDSVGAEQVDCGPGTDRAVKNATDVATDCEKVSLGLLVADFNGNGKSDRSVYRPSEHTWYADNGVTPFANWGIDNDRLVPGDYDGDGDSEFTVWRPSEGRWYVKDGVTPFTTWGENGDFPVPGDYDGDGDLEPAVYRPSERCWYALNGPCVGWGIPGDVLVPGDYDGDGDTDPAIWRPSEGRWYVKDGVTPYTTWGANGDIPVPGDYDGDGDTDMAVWRPSEACWYVLNQACQSWGIPGPVTTTSDRPQPGDYDGDGDTDRAIFRPSEGIWYVDDGVANDARWGVSCDILLPLPYSIRTLFPRSGACSGTNG